ncbi:WhiB family transcriptional regulator [Rhodococcus sp. IEGM 1381]|nr:WhiB family transcriptional regulator [Rhodococcus sp. IEGM 1381]MDI9894532.1 WhiB family transcriptional regulator [Rhodococcus sp. IEGM 1381]
MHKNILEKKLPAPTAQNWDWQLSARCRDMPSGCFFAPQGLRGPTLGFLEREAKSICALCPVTRQCLSYAIDHGEPHGVWGGMTAKERRAISAYTD